MVKREKKEFMGGGTNGLGHGGTVLIPEDLAETVLAAGRTRLGPGPAVGWDAG